MKCLYNNIDIKCPKCGGSSISFCYAIDHTLIYCMNNIGKIYVYDDGSYGPVCHGHQVAFVTYHKYHSEYGKILGEVPRGYKTHYNKEASELVKNFVGEYISLPTKKIEKKSKKTLEAFF